MQTSWVSFNGASGRKLDYPVVSLLRTGVLQLSSEAIKLLDGVREVELLYSPDDKWMGLKPSEGKPGSRRVTYGRRSGSINIKQFLRTFGIDHTESKRYRIKKDLEGMLVVDLGEPL